MRQVIKRALNQSAKPAAGAVLLLQVPRTNDKKELAAEQLFASLHGLLQSGKNRLFGPADRQRLSLEIAVQHGRIGFYVWVPLELKNFVQEQIYAQYPSVTISEVPDYTLAELPFGHTQSSALIHFSNNQALPIRTFPSFEVDPLAAITAALAQFNEDEEAWLQVVIRPAPNNWQVSSERYINNIRSGQSSSSSLLQALWKPPTANQTTTKLNEFEQARASAAEEKSHKLAYQFAIRIVYRGPASPAEAKLRLLAIAASFKQFNSTYLNGFNHKYLGNRPKAIDDFRNRKLNRANAICNIEEIASLYHLPHTNVETPRILWSSAKTAEPPANLPSVATAPAETISPMAITNFRDHSTTFGLPYSERNRHLYIIGQTGVGKSGLLELLTLADLSRPEGFAVIDPHGDYALNVLGRIPPERIQDVIYINPADVDYPVAFNPLEVQDSTLKTHVCSELIGVLKRMFDSWGPRLEYILRYCILALLDYPEATMLDITRILTDKAFRQQVLTYVEDPVVRNFWQVEFASWNDRFAAEAIAPVLNKIGAFTANPVVRNVIGQPKSSFNIRQIMDERKILIVNLSRGLIGEDNAALLGALMVTKIQMAAMSRANIPAAERTPFYLYVDEFQNFATDSFATILSEARKYGLCLTVANQYIAQMSPAVRDAVFGNVGSIIGFRMSADDAGTMRRYFEPVFDEHDLVHMHNRHFAISMTIAGEKVQAFSGKTQDLPATKPADISVIVAASRQQYAAEREYVEALIRDRYGVQSSSTTTILQPPRNPAIKASAAILHSIMMAPPKRSSRKAKRYHRWQKQLLVDFQATKG